MNGSMCTVLHVRNREIPIGCCCPRSMSRFSPLLWSSLHKLLVLARIGASSWYEIEPGGIAVRCLEFLMVSIWCFFHPTHQSCSPASASGRSPTRLSPIVTSRRWTSCKRCKHNAVSPFRTIRSVSVISLSSIGGLPCPHKRDLSGSNHSSHKLLCLSHLLISETFL
jgi:hypothetical protein